jgi:hypothetical protein
MIPASLVLLVVSIAAMAQRVSDYHEAADQKLYMFSRVNMREFSYAGRSVTLQDEQTATGVVVSVRYGDDLLRLNATIAPGPEQLPHLVRHADWMQVLRFAEHGRKSIREADEHIRRGEERDRLVLVVRNPPRGADAHTWGQVWRKMWMFDLYEFLPDGGFAHERLGYPTNRRNEPQRPGELAEGTWQFYAALLVMPSGSKPSPKFTNDALKAMHWTLPVAALSVLLLVGSLAGLAAPPRRRE